MKRYLLTLLLLVLTSGWMSDPALGGVIGLLTPSSHAAQAVQPYVSHDKRDRDGLCDANARQQQPAAATLSDANGIHRICNSRPGRVLPSYGSKSGRTQGKFPFQQKYHLDYTLLSRRKQRLETAPFATAASCDYYVIALRHIIR